MIINRNSISNLRKLRTGDFAIPDLSWSLNPGGLTSIDTAGPRAIITMLNSRGFKEHIRSLLGNRIINQVKLFEIEDFNNLEIAILDKIKDSITAVKNGDELSNDQIITIVCGIHIWGGRTGRNLFVMGQGFSENFSIPGYRDMIKAIVHNREQTAIGIWENGNFRQIGPAFATKHLAFWTKSPLIDIKLPIFDSIINRIVFGDNAPPRYLNYRNYLSQMKKAATEINNLNPNFQGQFNVHHLERQLFEWNSGNTDESSLWQSIRTGIR
jgi:hypothetical protein